MRHVSRPFVKICCISSLEEASLAVATGASALGLVSAMPSGPGIIDDQTIALIAAAVPPPIATFLLTSRQTAESIVEQHMNCRTTTIQLVDSVDQAELVKLRQLLPGIKLVQVIHVSNEDSVYQALSIAPYVDALLLDSGNQNLPVKELGGTGRTHDWILSRRICLGASAPIFLAGGLGIANVTAAISMVNPFGIDLCSGVRTNGKLDKAKLHEFMTVVANNSFPV